VKVISDLGQHWKTLHDAVPQLHNSSCHESIDGLEEWLRTGRFPDGSFPLPNALLTPLVVVTHIVQYLEFEKLQVIERQDTETMGLCTGLLSAGAVSSAANLTQLERFGAAAIRLAMAIGAVVDARDIDTDTQDETSCRWSSFSVAWSSSDLDDTITSAIQEFPEVLLFYA
jgi:hypothetical protein